MAAPLDFDQIVQLAAASPETHTRLTQLLSEVDVEVGRILARADGACRAPTTAAVLTAARDTEAGPERCPPAAPQRAIVDRLCDRIGSMQRALTSPSEKQLCSLSRVNLSDYSAAGEEGTGLSRLEDMVSSLESQVCRSFCSEGELAPCLAMKLRLDDLAAEVEALQRRKMALKEDINTLLKQKNELEGGISALHWCRGGLSMQLGHMTPQVNSSTSNIGRHEPCVLAHSGGASVTLPAGLVATISSPSRARSVGGGFLSESRTAASGIRGPMTSRTAAAPAPAALSLSLTLPVAPAGLRPRSASPGAGPPGATAEDRLHLGAGPLRAPAAAPAPLWPSTPAVPSVPPPAGSAPALQPAVVSPRLRPCCRADSPVIPHLNNVAFMPVPLAGSRSGAIGNKQSPSDL